MADIDVCIIGSGAGAGPVAYEVSRAGYRVVILEKGPFYTEKDFFKDEVTAVRQSRFTSDLRKEPQIIERTDHKGGWYKESTFDNGWDFWNGNCVGGSSNFMSGFFHRLKPFDFHLLDEFGPVEGADIANWPISYKELEPYYAKVEKVVGVSGKVVDHPHAEPRSTPDYPMPPTAEHPLAQHFDNVTSKMGLHPFPVARCILSRPKEGRNGCELSGYCGSYGCTSKAKGSSRVSLIADALKTGRCDLRPHSHVTKLLTDASGAVQEASYIDREGKEQRVSAKIFVVACQAIESARLLLTSTSKKHPKGLGNSSGLVGKNLLFSAAASGHADLPYSAFDKNLASAMHSALPFINRALQDWYVLDEGPNKKGRVKGGTVDFLFQHPNPISRAYSLIEDESGELVWGPRLKKNIHRFFTEERHLIFETFMDWMPQKDCFVSLDDKKLDAYGNRVANVRVGRHPYNKALAKVIAPKAAEVLKAMGGIRITTRQTGGPATNLIAGTCRFGDDPTLSVLNKDCRAHDVENLYVTDASFMPTGGSVPYTFTIYANSFRVSDRIVSHLGGPKTL